MAIVGITEDGKEQFRKFKSNLELLLFSMRSKEATKFLDPFIRKWMLEFRDRALHLYGEGKTPSGKKFIPPGPKFKQIKDITTGYPNRDGQWTTTLFDSLNEDEAVRKVRPGRWVLRPIETYKQPDSLPGASGKPAYKAKLGKFVYEYAHHFDKQKAHGEFLEPSEADLNDFEDMIIDAFEGGIEDILENGRPMRS